MIRSQIYSNAIFLLLLVFIVFFTAYFVGWRDLSIGADSRVYAIMFENFNLSDPINTDPAYHYFMYFFKYMGLDYQYMFATHFIITFFLLLSSFVNFSASSNVFLKTEVYKLFILFLFIFSSSWFLVATTNGLRQGLGLAFVFYGMSLYFKNKYIILPVIAFTVACFFHKTILLLIPLLFFVAFSKIKIHFFALFLLLLLIGYALSFNEQLIESVSLTFNVSLYKDILLYGLDSPWYGFIPMFAVYTAFWFYLGYFLLIFGFITQEEKIKLVFCLKLYAVLCMYYFIFGFGGYSNRWGVAAWLFIPILQAVIVTTSKLPLSLQFSLCLLSVFSYSKYLYILQ